jgi:uncharacterized protein YecE (DUF72 family)
VSAEASPGRIRVGIGGWTYPPWRGLFYPPGLPHARELEFAASRLGAVEINATFYGRQSPASWRKWAETVPDEFQFAVKGSRFCVTRPRLAEASEGIRTFLDQGLEVLGSKLGPILWMLAAHRPFDRGDIAGFFEQLPTRLGDLSLRHVIEPRHESFRDEHFFELCRAHDVAVAFGDDDEFPCIDADTASFTYARLQRMREDVQTGYKSDALERFAARVREQQSQGKDSYIFLINGAKLRAPAAALALQDRLGIAPG